MGTSLPLAEKLFASPKSFLSTFAGFKKKVGGGDDLMALINHFSVIREFVYTVYWIFLK